MRLPTPLRLLISCALVSMFALAAQAYGHAAVIATTRPGAGAINATRTALAPLGQHAIHPLAAGTPGPGTPTLTATTPDSSGVPGQTVRYDFTLTNNGPNDDSYVLSVANITVTGGATPLPATNIVFTVGSPVRLSVNTQITFSANVLIPSTATPGTIYTITLQAASQNGGGTASAVITTT
ncbi:MAG: hypothetical protein H0X37_04940, partial [Herpetosiphonaceae bacterium]|nr:hypothetical protein [Herpetosiphonaceae bacterium]